MKARELVLLCGVSPGVLLGVACFPELPGVEGECREESSAVVDCGVEGYVLGEIVDAGLVAYSCSGEARPDADPIYDDGFPKGDICAEKGPVGDGSRAGYCCTKEPVDCAYDPASDCKGPWSGFECRGTNRPESLNPAITCGNGIRHGELTQYCCSGTPEPPECQQSDVAGCTGGLLGFLCEGDGLPRGENLGSNKSRPDHYNFTCDTPKPAPNPDYKTYCCFAPPLVLEGGSCVNHTAVPGCDVGRFGFACYGPDTPDEDYLALNCPEPGVKGTSREGFPATLYCCDFK